MLEKLGHRVQIEADGNEAVEAARTGVFDLILMDGQMPNMDGYEAARRIRSLNGAAATTPVIALTAFAQPKPVVDFAGLPDRPEKLQFAPLVYEPPNPPEFRVLLKSGPVAYVAADEEAAPHENEQQAQKRADDTPDDIEYRAHGSVSLMRGHTSSSEAPRELCRGHHFLAAMDPRGRIP
jgi:CheY-like chemotaxis protein